MLEIIVPANEIYLPGPNQFVAVPTCILTLEHSLISVAKWESKWHTPISRYKKREPLHKS